MSKYSNSFFAGIEEVASRALSLILSVLLFSVYALAKEDLYFEIASVAGSLVLFWLVYETLAYVFFLVFNYFSNKSEKGDEEDLTIDK